MNFSIQDNNHNLSSLQQYAIRICESEKKLKIIDLLEQLDFNQVVIFVSEFETANELNRQLENVGFSNSLIIHSGMQPDEKIFLYASFNKYEKRILVSNDVFGRGANDLGRDISIVINYDFPYSTDQFMHQVGRTGHFGILGLVISFVSSEDDEKRLQEVRERFTLQIPDFPNHIDTKSYMM
jgi:ATP-dependent RNA helicase UAP56/SUB2